jgi:hypothetical protein
MAPLSGPLAPQETYLALMALLGAERHALGTPWHLFGTLRILWLPNGTWHPLAPIRHPVSPLGAERHPLGTPGTLGCQMAPTWHHYF